jgi:diaminohydroxyphosphoribosylaminopyrimidine deaminase/5-amino-6-(5-phosphoribosylamino)uracil reductase
MQKNHPTPGSIIAGLVPIPTFETGDERYFSLALEMARFAAGSTWPNPFVGAVLTLDGAILAQGFTHPPGGMHAEVHAISEAKKTAGATLYVTLEPCRHVGRTGPCTAAIIEAEIVRVVYGALDPNPLMAGAGVQELKDAGLMVEQISAPDLQMLSAELIKPFARSILHKRPWVIMKIATSADNKIALAPGVPCKITGPRADETIHRLRRGMDSILVGGNTVVVDNPQLTARLGDHAHGGQPERAVICGSEPLPASAKIFADPARPPWLFATPKSLDNLPANITAKKFKLSSQNEPQVSLSQTLEVLGAEGITTVMIEPGAKLFASCLAEGIADEIWWFQAPHTLGDKALDLGTTPQVLPANWQEKASGYLDLDRWQIYGPAAR